MELQPRLSLEGAAENVLQPLDPLHTRSNLVLAIIQKKRESNDNNCIKRMRIYINNTR